MRRQVVNITGMSCARSNGWQAKPNMSNVLHQSFGALFKRRRRRYDRGPIELVRERDLDTV